MLHRMSVDSGSGPTFHPPPAPLSGTVVCGVRALHKQVSKASLDFGSFYVLVRVSVVDLALSRVGPPPTWRRRVRMFSPTPCVGSPGRDPCRSASGSGRAHAAGSRPRLGLLRRTSPTSVRCVSVCVWHVCSELSISQVTSHDSHHRPCPMSPPPEASSARRGCGTF